MNLIQEVTGADAMPTEPSVGGQPRRRGGRVGGRGLGFITRWIAGWIVGSSVWVTGASAQVVINEIFYHAPQDVAALQWVEIHNAGAAPVDLTGWALTKGIQFRFAAGTRLDAGGFAVLCRSNEVFRAAYGTSIALAGQFASNLSKKGERLELSDATGRVVDSVKFKDSDPWPREADGESASLERLCPTASGDQVANWAASPLNADRGKAGGTPGRVNASFSRVVPPLIGDVRVRPTFPKPGEPIFVEADIDAKEVDTVLVRFRRAGSGFEKPEETVAMRLGAGGVFAASIPAGEPGSLCRIAVEAVGKQGASRIHPSPLGLRPAISVYVPTAFEPAGVPMAWILPTTEAELAAAKQRRATPTFGFGPFGGFGGGPGGGPPPGGPSPLEEARTKTRGDLSRDLDLSGPWMAMSATEEMSDAVWTRLREGIRGKLPQLRGWITDRLAEAKTEADLGKLGAEARRLREGWASEWVSDLGARQRAAIAEWVAGGVPAETHSSFGGAIRRRVDLEGAWFAITLNAELEPERRIQVRKALALWTGSLDELLASVARGEGADTRFRDQREKADELREAMSEGLRSHLNESQLAALDAWKRQPREVTVGLRAPEGPSRGGPGGNFRGRGFGRGFGRGAEAEEDETSTASHRTAFVYYDPATRQMELFDFVQVTGRKGGQKIRFHKGQTLAGMSTVNLTYEGETAAIVEALAYEVYRRAGVLTGKSFHVRLWQGGEPAGYQLLFEQPNRAFFRGRDRRDDGNLYKLLWFEQGVAGQHEKKSPADNDRADVVALVDALDRARGEEQWDVIRKHFEVDEVASFFAVNTVLSHWDGFFNNYFAYHDVNGTGKWSMIPWDQDSTWGLRAMGGGRGQVFYDMPLTFGMDGDQPSGGWWRPPGWFSGPLLAHPKFRKVFLTRTREVLETVYSESVMGPVITDMEKRLLPEARFRAEAQGQDLDGAEASMRGVFNGAREHLKKRREFLLSQAELASVEAK